MTSPDTSLDAQGTIPTPSASEAARERASGWRTIRRVLPYLWPEGQDWVKYRVVAALAMLVLAKLVAVSTPFFYKAAVDALGGDGTGWLLAVGAIGLTVAYGVARLMEIGFQELRNVLFTRVGQRALRQLALETFGHIHRLSLRYHISRKTGGLSRIIERGVKGVDFPAALHAVFDLSAHPAIADDYGNLHLAIRLALSSSRRGHNRTVCVVYLQGHGMARQTAPRDE